MYQYIIGFTLVLISFDEGIRSGSSYAFFQGSMCYSLLIDKSS